ncbi:hypothetical protein ACFV5G_02735 [Streptomyces sp. NPDC059766]|uniref:hypothetical protein n=1 Tax=Streptomyces sp. NPDC059766 TaxID=3346940 RepID=UPI0036676F64
MRTHRLWGKVATAVVLVCGVAGCSTLPGASGKDKGEKQEATGPTYGEALEAMRPDVVSALEAVMPHAEPDESAGADDCGGLDILDSKDGSKRNGSLDIDITGAPSDTRQSKELVEAVVKQLTNRGWVVEKRSDTSPDGHPDGYMQYLKKSGMRGTVAVSASPFKLTSGKVIQTLGASVVTDCLRNPNWHKN